MIVAWVVGFAPAGNWFSRWLRPGYAHCWCARPLWGDLWLWVEWTPGRLVVCPVGSELVTAAAARATEVWAVDVDSAAVNRRHPLPCLGWWHCVRVVCDALGVAVPRWPTPWGLRCALSRRAGAWQAAGHERRIEQLGDGDAIRGGLRDQARAPAEIGG